MLWKTEKILTLLLVIIHFLNRQKEKLKIQCRLSTISKTSKNLNEIMLFDVSSMYILKVYSIHYTLRQNANVKKSLLRTK